MNIDNSKIYRIEQRVNVDVTGDCSNANRIVINHMIYAMGKMVEEHPTAELKVRMDVDWYNPIYPCYAIVVEGLVRDGDRKTT